MEQIPTFEAIKKATRNGQAPVARSIDGRYFRCSARTSRGHSCIDFDLHSGNHDLRPAVQERLWLRHQDYCSAFNFRPRTHVHFSKTSIVCEVKGEHAEEWFSLLWEVVADTDCLQRIRSDLLAKYVEGQFGEIIAGGIIIPEGAAIEGEVVRVIAPAFKQIIDLLQFDYAVLHTMSPRHFEVLLAAAYERLGFDRVVLTPGSGDHGADLIVEKYGVAAMKFFVEAKHYRPGRRVKASEVRSLLGTLVTQPPTTRAVLVTTADFAPGIKTAPNIAPLLGSQLELLNGPQLVEKLIQIERAPKSPILGF